MAEELLHDAADRPGEAQRRIRDGEADAVLVVVGPRPMIDLGIGETASSPYAPLYQNVDAAGIAVYSGVAEGDR